MFIAVRWIVCTLFYFLASYVWAQGEQSVHIAQGRSVTLRAQATGALSYLWLHNGNPINGHHDAVLTVNQAGIYTVVALGTHCDSDISDPVEVIVDPDSPPVVVDMMIRNEPDKPAVFLGEEFTYQIFIQNNSQETATGVTVNIALPRQVSYRQIFGIYQGTVTYDQASHTLLWSIPTVEGGQSETLSIHVVAERPGVLSQIATVASAENDQNMANNKSVALVDVISFKIPNVFTPNGDGVNDTFVIKGLEAFEKNELIIYNRHGITLYTSDQYHNDWDAANLNEGTYYYILKVWMPSQKWETFKGFVTVIRNVPLK